MIEIWPKYPWNHKNVYTPTITLKNKISELPEFADFAEQVIIKLLPSVDFIT